MVYSTCSILEDENENIIREILETKKVELEEINFRGIEELPDFQKK